MANEVETRKKELGLEVQSARKDLQRSKTNQ